MRRTLFLLVATALWAAFGSGAVSAQVHMMPGWIPPHACMPEMGHPALPESLSGTAPGVAFRVCNDIGRNAHYFLREPRPNRDGVCRVYETEIFPGSPTDMVFYSTGYLRGDRHRLKGWNALTPEGWTAADGYTGGKQGFALVRNGACPAVLDNSYIAVTNVPDGLLKAFDGAWQTATASSEAFDKAFAKVTIESLISGPDIKDRLRGSALAGRVQFENITCTNDGCLASDGRFVIGFDIGPSGVVFTKLGSVLVI